jgi:hypothetical protein
VRRGGDFVQHWHELQRRSPRPVYSRGEGWGERRFRSRMKPLTLNPLPGLPGRGNEGRGITGTSLIYNQ